MIITTVNPATGKVLKKYDAMSLASVQKIIEKSQQAFIKWRDVSLEGRAEKLLQVAELLITNKKTNAKLISQEMGKPVKHAELEIEKCAACCRHYATQAKHYLAPEHINTDYTKSYITYEPMGVIFSIMPWNFPFWQVIRFVVPNLMAGNAVLLKHASISTGASLAIEKIMQQALPENLFRSLVIKTDLCEAVIKHPYIQGVTLTGSNQVGSIVASQAGAALKKTVMELGGSDPYIILDSNDDKALENAANACVANRILVAGQVCISAKRIIVLANVYDKFVKFVKTAIAKYSPSDPMNDDCNLGPLSSVAARNHVHTQVQDSIKAGAVCEIGGVIPDDMPGAYYPATLLLDVPKQAPAYKDEIFGPVVSIIKALDEEDAIKIANDNIYGLGAGVFTQDIEHGEFIARHKLHAGTAVVNSHVTSNPWLPFGGSKASGFGRELGAYGIREFTNVKTVCVTDNSEI